jgi:DHA2 family multidrug resistance protein
MLMKRADARLIVISGLSVFAVSCFMNAHLSPKYAGDQLWLPNIVRSLGQAVVLTPLAGIAMAGIARQDSAAASGLFNMLRNLGRAFGTALFATLVTKREQFHSNVTGTSVTLFRESVRQRLADLTLYFSNHGISDSAAAQQKAIVALGDIVHRQALIMGYADTFVSAWRPAFVRRRTATVYSTSGYIQRHDALARISQTSRRIGAANQQK